MSNDSIRENLISYRPEIDGLRAVAIIPVIFFHAGFDVFSGGFVGVDIFFVISGYLITSIIVREIEQKRFSVIGFYERRARRLLPALFFVIICCLPFLWMFLLPEELKVFGQSLVSVVTFSSNIYFWLTTSYFAPATEELPLLHTWSLAVEEQFYALFPLLLLLLWRFGRLAIFWFIAFMAALSLALSHWASTNMVAANFFLLPTRAWELLIGALLAIVHQVPGMARLRAKKYVAEVLSITGLAVILYSIFCFDKTIPFPSLYTLLPVLGAAIIIAFASKENWVGAFLSSGPFVFVGLISYSAYLWHQPILAIIRTSVPYDFLLTDLLLVASIFLLAFLTYRFVETPFRRASKPSQAKNTKRFFVGCVCFIALLSVFGLASHYTSGFPLRLAEKKRVFLDEYQSQYPKFSAWKKFDLESNYRLDCDFLDIEHYKSTGNSNKTRPSIDLKSCYPEKSGSKPTLLIWGDSHAQQLFYGLNTALGQQISVGIIASAGCKASMPLQTQYVRCLRSNEAAISQIRNTPPDIVVLAQAQDHSAAELAALSRLILEMGVTRVVIVGPVPQWKIDMPKMIVRYFWNDDAKTRDWSLVKQDQLDSEKALQHYFAQEVVDPRIRFASLFNTFCNEAGCLFDLDPSSKGRQLTTWDYGHLTPNASLMAAKQALEQAIFGN